MSHTGHLVFIDHSYLIIPPLHEAYSVRLYITRHFISAH